MGRDITVLHVDDDRMFAELTETALERESDLDVVSLSDPTDVCGYLERGGIDCVISDYEMPEMNGLDLLRDVRERYPDLPFVLFTGKGSEEIASDAISAGVDDYLQKKGGGEQFDLLANRIRNAVSRRRAERERAESERQLSTLISNLPGMVYRCLNEPTWPITYASDGCEELTGYRPDAIESGEVVWGEDVIHPDDQGALWEPVQAALDAREPFEVTYRIITADGKTKSMWERGRGVYENGDLVALEGFIADISDRVAVEEELRALNDKVNALHEVAGRLAAAADESAVYEIAIEAAEDVLDFAVCYVALARGTQFELQAVSEDVPDDRFEQMALDAGAVGAAYQRGEALRVEDAVGDPIAEPVDDTYPSGISLPVGDDGVFQALSTEPAAFDEEDLELAQLLIAHVEQAVDRVRNRNRLQAERDRFMALFEHIPDPAVIAAFPEGEPIVRSVNPAFEETFGYSAAEIVNQPLDDFIVPDEYHEEGDRLNDRVVAGKHLEAEVLRVTRSGDRRRFLFRSVTVDSEDDPVLGFGVYTDVTDRDDER